MGYVPPHALENLKNYQYKGVDKLELATCFSVSCGCSTPPWPSGSIVSRYVLNPFWNWFVTLWLLSVAPNTITLTSFNIIFFNFLMLLYYNPAYLFENDIGSGEGSGAPPHWVHYRIREST